MDQTRTVLGRDVLGVDHVVRFGREVDQGEGALVGPALHLGAGERLAGGLPALAQRLLQQRLGDDELLLAVRRDDVADLGVGGDRRVGDQRPGVVVQTRRAASLTSGPEVSGKRTKTEGSTTVS